MLNSQDSKVYLVKAYEDNKFEKSLNLKSIIENNNYSYLYKNEQIKKRRKKNLKDPKDVRIYVCDLCNKSYYSYPAIYTHKRNKHDVIPVTRNQNKFKGRNIFKFNNNTDLKEKLIINKILQIYLFKLNLIYHDKNSSLFNIRYRTIMDAGYLKLKRLLNENWMNKIIDSHIQIDDALALYIINFAKIDINDTYIDQVIIYCILLRIYLNIIGWDYIEIFKNYGIHIIIENTYSFTMNKFCEYIPDLINEFVSVFMKMDYNILIEEDIMLDITRNFCNWLFINNLTQFKLVDNQ